MNFPFKMRHLVKLDALYFLCAMTHVALKIPYVISQSFQNLQDVRFIIF